MSRNKGTDAGQHSFARVPTAEIQRSKFNRSSNLKTTFDAGLLIPMFCEEALPGDTMNLRMHNFARLATPIYPLLDNMYIDTFFFSVPIRLLWDNWQKFNGEQTDPGDSVDFTIPEMTVLDVQNSSIHDYMGIPTGIDITFNALHHRAYNLIFNEWFRSQDLTDSVPINRDDGPDDPADYTLLRRGKRHDYFTSCLPFAQKGDSVSLPLGTSAPVVSSGDGEPSWNMDGDIRKLESAGGGNQLRLSANTTNIDTFNWNTTALETDLSSATAATINQIRQAFQIQRLLERDARGGSRYTEIIRSHFGISSPDQRLQRPEYLGGNSERINITPVAQTTGSFGEDTVGKLAAFGTGTGSTSFVKSFDEHCVVIGLVMMRADLNYQQGLPRMFSRQTRYDYYWPALAHLGEQAVLNQEIYAQDDGTAANTEVFGYQERYAEYRYKASQITGQMRSNFTTPLDAWHLAQDFENLPVLDNEFIEENPPVDRVIAVPSEPHLLFDAYFDFTHARPMPTFGTPGLIDHF